MKKFLASRWFLIGLVLVLAIGIWGGTRLKAWAEHKTLRDGVVAAVLFVMALPLEPRVIWRTLRRPLAPVLAVSVSYLFLPLVAWGIAWTLGTELGTGLLVGSTTPCTVASAAVWTRRAGGNDAVATFVTVVTNLICFVAMPAWLAILLGDRVSTVQFEFVDSVVQLGKLVVVPMVAAQIVRLWKPIGEFAVRRKIPLSALTQCGILYMVFIGAIQTGHQLQSGQERMLSWSDFLLMIAAVNAVHLSMLWWGWRLSAWCGVPREDQIAVAFSGSQKTLMIGLKVCLDLQVSILPMVAFHVSQLLVDTLIADRMAKSVAPAALDPQRPAA